MSDKTNSRKNLYIGIGIVVFVLVCIFLYNRKSNDDDVDISHGTPKKLPPTTGFSGIMMPTNSNAIKLSPKQSAVAAQLASLSASTGGSAAKPKTFDNGKFTTVARSGLVNILPVGQIEKMSNSGDDDNDNIHRGDPMSVFDKHGNNSNSMSLTYDIDDLQNVYLR